MAETETQNESTLPTKRKVDDDPIPENDQEEENHCNKSQKLESLTNNLPIIQEKHSDNSQTLEPSIDTQNDTVQEGDHDDDEEEVGDYEDEEEDGEEAVVDKKGKGILIEEEEEDDDDDDGSESECGDDSEEAEEDDPLAEVDLDNILPSRTRRKVVPPGVYIANDNLANDDDDDDSDA